MKGIISICISFFFLMTFNSSAQDANSDIPPLRHSPNREFHMAHLSLDFHFNIDKKELFGKATEKIVPLRENYDEVHLDAADMAIDNVMMNNKNLKFSYDGKDLIIHLNKPYNLNDTLTYSITYSTIPTKGIFFILPDSGYPNRTPEIWSQSEEEDAQYWFPCHDYPDDFSTSDMSITVPEDWVAVSNGTFKNVLTNKKDKTKTFYWVESLPHVVYLNSIVAGKYKIIKDKFDNTPVYYYVEPEYYNEAKENFKNEPDILKFFSDITGYKYPWEKLSLSTVTDFTEGGMENVSAITLTDNTLHDMNAEPNESSVSLIAHETAHQWFGDLLTCRSWSNAWLNEGFATFFDALYQRHLNGNDDFSYVMNNNYKTTITVDNRRRQSTYYFRYNVADDVFSDYIYPRGASILNMIRGILGDSLFFRAINHYVHKFQHQNVDTHDFQNAIQEATGENLYWFFNEWVYMAGHPKFDVDYSYNPSNHKLTLTTAQTQKVDSLTPIYKMPVNILIETAKEKINKTVWIDSLKNSFDFTLADKPLMVNFDEGNLILKEINFKKSEEELAYQIKNDPDAAGRIWAADELSKLTENTSAESALINSLKNDKFWAVREECANDLGEFISDNAKNALIAAMNDKDQRVQSTAINSLSEFSGKELSALIKNKFSSDNNYFVKAACISTLASIDTTNALPQINEGLKMDSYRQIIKAAALRALTKVDSVQGYETAIKFSKYGQDEDLRNSAIFEIANINIDTKKSLEILERYAKDPYIWAREHAYYALGRLGDKEAIPLLKEREKIEKNSRLKEDAERAVSMIERQQ